MKRVFKEEFPDNQVSEKKQESTDLNIKIPGKEESVYYNDLESRNDQDFFLFSGEFEWKDSSMKALRYIFAIKTYSNKQSFSMVEILELLNHSNLIILAIDTSDIKEINQLLP